MTANRWSIKDIQKRVLRSKAERGLYFLSFTKRSSEYRCWLCGEEATHGRGSDSVYCNNCSSLFEKQNIEQRKHVQRISGKTVAFVIPADESQAAFEIDTEQDADFMKTHIGGDEWFITSLWQPSCSDLAKLHFANFSRSEDDGIFNKRATDAVRFLGYRCELRKFYGTIIIMGPAEKPDNPREYLTLLPREIDLIKKNM